ncbi:hypothetical protein LNL84_11670 [Vibrio sp. ZSDZ34]|jgi:hypothetical protein|uniref:Uncharacterized protein n=1 Tax=Vibrio gelatinilyticus TaxID=2893468 RepID=A0A9X1WFJ7_9VIBR|nr:hypothetical protein [Vibrio gelatinilyticus]MCJ2377490.1 hypothetical protein [Vibrio gelatinilyticus]
MLHERLERINRLRKEALSNPDFVESARAHEKAIQQLDEPMRVPKNKKLRSLSDIYSQYHSPV